MTAAACLLSALLIATAGCGSSTDGPLAGREAVASAPIQPAEAVDRPVPHPSPPPLRAPAIPAPPGPEFAVEDLLTVPEDPAEQMPIDPSQTLARGAFERLTDPTADPQTCAEAQETLLSLGESALPVLADALKQGDALHRETAASILALTGTPSDGAIGPLRQALEDESPYVRVNAATALVLSPHHAEVAVPVLLDLLDSDDRQLRQIAAANLEFLSAEAIPHLDQLTAALAAESPPEVLLLIVELLGRVGPQASGALPQLRRIAAEKSGDLREAAARAVDLIDGDPNEM